MRHRTYSFGGNDEQLLAFGPEDAAQRILIVPPLFDEMNRMRRTLVEAMRMLEAAGVTSGLLDLPGCNESRLKLEDQNIERWKEAVDAAALAIGATHIFSVRGGALVDDQPKLPTMRLAPVKGASLLKMLVRTRVAGDKEAGLTTSAESLADAAKAGPVELAGNMVGPQLWADLNIAVPNASSDAKEIKPNDVGGSPLWLRAEPQYDAAMASGLAQMLAEWSNSA